MLFCLNCAGRATSLFTRLDSTGSAVGKRPIGDAIATSECPTQY